MPKHRKNLTDKQQKFVHEYLVDLNGTQAAIRAGYSKKTAAEAAYELLIKPHIKEAVEKLQKKTDFNIERCMLEYKRLATFDIRKAYNEDGSLKPIHELDDDTAAAICGIESEDLYEGRGEDREKIGTLRKIKTVDKRAAIHDAMRHFGGFAKDALAVTGPDGGPIQIEDVKALTAEQKMKLLKNML